MMTLRDDKDDDDNDNGNDDNDDKIIIEHPKND